MHSCNNAAIINHMTGPLKTEKAKQIYTVDIPSPSPTAHEPSTELIIKKKL
jgi:hypothetical protein